MKNLKRRLTVAGLTAIGLSVLAALAVTACNKSESTATTTGKKKLVVYTHQTQLILGDEKKDASDLLVIFLSCRELRELALKLIPLFLLPPSKRQRKC